MIYWYHFYINHPGGSRILNTIWHVYYFKGLLTKAELSVKTCNQCQQFKHKKTIYGKLPTNIVASLKPWILVHINLIGPYSKSIIQQQPYIAIIQKYMSLACMTMIDPATGWFKKI